MLYIGAKVRRLKMGNQDGTTDIPKLTPEAEHLSTLSTLKEIREIWKPNAMSIGGPFGSTLAPPLTLGKPSVRKTILKAKSPRKILK